MILVTRFKKKTNQKQNHLSFPKILIFFSKVKKCMFFLYVTPGFLTKLGTFPPLPTRTARFHPNVYWKGNKEDLRLVWYCSITNEANYWVFSPVAFVILRGGRKQMGWQEYCWVPKTLMSAWDEIPCTVSRTNRRKELLMSEQELGIQPEVSRSSWSRGKE